MEIKILGTGCAKCKLLHQATINALAELDMAANVEKIEDIVEIMKYNVMTTPALVIDGKVVVKGRVPSNNEMKEILSNKVFHI